MCGYCFLVAHVIFRAGKSTSFETMKFATPSLMERLANPVNPLHSLITQAKLLDASGKALAARLGSPLNRHCRLARISLDTIVLQVDSSVWYSKVRFLRPDIVTFFRTEYRMLTVTKVRIYVTPPEPPDSEPRQRPQMSVSTAKLLRSVANATESPTLREAWLRLARNGPRKDS